MSYSESTAWKWPGKQFAFGDCDDPATFVPLGNGWETIPTQQEIEAAQVEYEAAQEARLYFDTGLGFRLKTDDATQAELTKLVTLLDTAEGLGQPAATVSLFADGQLWALPLIQFKTMILAYGTRCYQLKLAP